MSVLRMTRAAVPHMKAAGGGAVVNITALSAIQPVVGFGLSVATWAAVIGLAKICRASSPQTISVSIRSVRVLLTRRGSPRSTSRPAA